NAHNLILLLRHNRPRHITYPSVRADLICNRGFFRREPSHLSQIEFFIAWFVAQAARRRRKEARLRAARSSIKSQSSSLTQQHIWEQSYAWFDEFLMKPEMTEGSKQKAV